MKNICFVKVRQVYIHTSSTKLILNIVFFLLIQAKDYNIFDESSPNPSLSLE